MNTDDVIAAWDQADPKAIHPSRDVSEDAYWASGDTQAAVIATVLPTGAKVLDFGCGDGRVALGLHRRGFTVVGADPSSTMLARLAANEPAIRAVHCTADTLTRKLRGKVDAAVCLAVLIHQDYPTAEGIVTTLAKAVKPGGLLILDWPTSDAPIERRSWIGVTTWAPAAQDELAARLGLARVDSDLPWSTFTTEPAGAR